MAQAATAFVCGGCGRHTADGEPPFACAGVTPGDDIDHVLVRQETAGPLAWPGQLERVDENPFIRYRALLHPYHVARAGGLSDARYCSLAARLDAEVARVERRPFGFRVTPLVERADLRCLVKDETDNVAGSPKARFLMGVLLHLEVLEALGRGAATSGRDLVTAGCGNAVLAAAVVARAGRRRLRVLVPVDANPAVLARLAVLGCTVEVCDGRPEGDGDPARLRLREELAAGALPFTCRGPESGLSVDGGRTLGYEIVEALARHRGYLDHLVVQVGGGALGSAIWQALDEALRLGVLPRLPRIHLVRPAGADALDEAWNRLETTMESRGEAQAGTEAWVAEAARHRSRYLPASTGRTTSLAHDLVGDEVADRVQLLAALRAGGGSIVHVDDEALRLATRMANDHRGEARPVDESGSAGLAGLLELRRAGRIGAHEQVAILFTGARRGDDDRSEPQRMRHAG